ncbi:hypothetical protein 2 [Hubei tombus-like virus 16]|uniref:hypothetical protein 2 n=1 Tax=Hubei tombus-like virus 16 TaxID=1923262 RepID=UPI00090A1CBF|nr:hypothetical protein 2 [Hubei tombus-like virus 16]APG76398.1 hypothetical protein 2 [Hubei tombus-like virus 16]
MFVKPDKIEAGEIQDKAPRAIQYRGPAYNLEMLRYIKPFEHKIYDELHLGNYSRTRAIVKGLNNYQRAELFFEKLQNFQQPAFLLIDHSKFDSTVRVEHLRSTHRKYMKAFNSKHLWQLCKVQISNKCYSKNGIHYTSRGTRMSGDPDTGCGNSVINGDCLHEVLRVSGIAKYEIMLDGDDSIVIIEKGALSAFKYDHFERLGFETKMSVVYDYHEVEFCRSKPMMHPRPCFIRDPKRTISNTMMCLKHYAERDYKSWLAAVGLCELACNDGVPVISVLGRTLSGFSKRKLFDEDTLWKMGNLAGGKYDTPITTESRLEYAMTWGVDCEVQLLLEEEFKTSIDDSFHYCKRIPRVKQRTNIKSTRENFNGRTTVSVWTAASAYQSLDQFSSSSWWCSG